VPANRNHVAGPGAGRSLRAPFDCIDRIQAREDYILVPVNLIRQWAENAATIVRTRPSSRGLDHTPSRLTLDPTISASADVYSAMFSGVTPLPTSVARFDPAATALTSAASVALPVATPETITPSAWKNCAAFAVSASETSAVIAGSECAFLMSAKTRMCWALIARR